MVIIGDDNLTIDVADAELWVRASAGALIQRQRDIGVSRELAPADGLAKLRVLILPAVKGRR